MTTPNADDSPDRGRWVRLALQEHERALMRYAVRLLGGDVDWARDVVQDTFLRLWQAQRSRVEDHLTEWLYTVCRNRCLDVLRKERRMSLLSLSETETDRRLSPSAQPSVAAERPETTSEVLRALGDLPPRQQEILRFKFQSDRSYKEIARIMGMSVTNVGFQIHTGLKAIRERMKIKPAVRLAAVSSSSAPAPASTRTSAS